MNKKEREQLGLSFYDIAESDLNSALILYRNGIFHNAVFFLQQGIEKLIKGMGLYFDIISPNQLKSVNHFASDIFKKSAEALLKENRLLHNKYLIDEDMTEAIQHQDEERKKSIDLIKKIKQDGVDPNISLEELDKLIADIHGEAPTETFNLQTIAKENAETAYAMMKEGKIKEKYKKEQIKLSDKQDEEVKKAIHLIHEYTLKIDIANRTLLLLDVVFHAHQNISRYPCEEHGESPLDIYSIDHPIIQRFEKLLEYAFLSLRLTDEVIQDK